MSKHPRMTLRRANTLPSNSLLSSISSWGDGVMAPPPLPLRPYVPTHPTDLHPLDLLEGTMDLAVTLPSGKVVIMNVYRSTPMMDLMVQVTTAHHINPGDHVIQVISDNMTLSYKPSTPIGTLDTNAIKVVAKNKINEMAQQRKMNLHQEALERNIRLKVNLPHNQLAVYRVPPKALISDIFTLICEDKNLDSESHEMRHPVNLDERLRGSCSLSDYQLREVCVVSSDFRPPPLSVTDLITMSSIAHPEDKKRRSFLGLFSRKAKSSTGDSSVSSGSAGERSVSPARSDDSADSHPTPQPLSAASSSGTLTNVNNTNNKNSGDPVRTEAPCRNSVSLHNSMTSIHSPPARMSRPVSMISLTRSRKRPAPVPPQMEGGLKTREEQSHYRDPSKIQLNGKVISSKEKQSLSRHSSDSSGYHESDMKSSQTRCENTLNDGSPVPRKHSGVTRISGPSRLEVGSLEAPKKPIPSSTISTSGSTLSISSLSKGKRKAPSPPKPPVNGGGPSAIPESPEEVESREGTHSCEVEDPVSRNVEEKTENSVPSYQEEGQATVTTTSPHSENRLETEQPQLPSTETCPIETDSSHDHNSPTYSTSTTTVPPTTLSDTHDTSCPTPPDTAHNEDPAIVPSVDPCVVHPSSSQVEDGDQPHSRPSQISSDCMHSSVDCSTLPSPQTLALSQRLKEAPTQIFALHLEPTSLASAPSPLKIGLKTTRCMTPSPPNSKANDKFVGSLLGIEADLKSSTPNRLSAAGNNILPPKHRAKKGPKEKSSGETNKYTENTIPRRAKKILDRLPLFGSLSRRKKAKNDHLSWSETRKNEPNLSSSNESLRDAYHSQENIFLRPEKAEEELNMKIGIFELKTSYSSLSSLSSELNSFDRQNSLSRDDINSTPHEIDRVKKNPIPIPRKTNPAAVIPAPRKLVPLAKSNVESTLKTNSPPINLDKANIISEGKTIEHSLAKKYHYCIPTQVSNLGSLRSWKTTGDLNDLDGSPSQPNVAYRSFNLESGASWKSSVHTSSSPTSLSFDAENCTHPDVESLSLETTDAEMLNPKDIQRPKRQKRKRIPEEFMKKSPPSDSSDSSCEKSLERIDLNNTSNGNLAIELSSGKQTLDKSNHPLNHSTDQVSKDKICSLQSVTENRDLDGSVNEACNGDVTTPLSKPSVLYVEMISEEESSTDPVPPVRASKQSYTSKVQLSLHNPTGNPVTHNSMGSRSAISISRLSSSESFSYPTEVSKQDVIAELKSAIEASSDEDHPPRILNLKPKGKDWNDAARTASDYNVILSFGNSESSPKIGPLSEASMTSSSSGEKKSLTRSSSSTSYESIDNPYHHVGSEVSKANPEIAIRNSRSSTESSYESAPPPLPESRIPVILDSSSKTSSATVSRQSSFSDYDSQSSPSEFVKPSAPAFSISTYQSRASKVSYDKKLSRSGSLTSVKGLHGQAIVDGSRQKGGAEEKASEGDNESRRLCRSGSQRNEVFRSDDIRKKSTSTTFLNSPLGEWNELRSIHGPIRSFVKSQSKSSLFESGASDASSKTNQHGSVQFELASAKDSLVFPRPFGKPSAQLRKTRSTFDIRAPEARISEGYQTIPDSGLANEYIRLQDDFMKWQNQLLQNQQILHNRVAPIAANPPTLNSVGIVNKMNQGTSDAPVQKRKPIEISIPIRLEDSDEDDKEPLRQTQPIRLVREPVQPTKGPQVNQTETGPNLWTKLPSVPIGAWQERPMPPRGDTTERMRPQVADMPRPFGQPSGMVTFAQQSRCPPSPPQHFVQPVPQQRTQGFYQQMPQSGYQQVPQTSFQQPSSQSGTRTQPILYDPREEAFHNGDEGINARFSSVVTLNKDKGDQNNALAKDKVRSVVQLNNAAEVAPQARSGPPFHSRIISASSQEPVMEEVGNSSNPPLGGFAEAPMSSRLVQQAVQHPLGRAKVSPPKMERLPSPPEVMRRLSPQKMDRHPSPPKEPSPEPKPSTPPFAGVKLRPVESRISPPKTTIPQPPSSEAFGPPPPPPPPPSKTPPAPPPPPGMPEDRRTSTGKKIISSTNTPQLDARQELMMAIRQFGGASNLKRSVYPPPGVQRNS